MQDRELNIALGPIQGITDFHFRNMFAKHFGGVDRFFMPYVRFDKGKLNQRKLKDALPENNLELPLVAQVMANSTPDFLELCNALTDLGYKEINWNLGCPYPMVTNRGLGAGLLNQPEKIFDILDNALPKINASISIKMRSGLDSPEQIWSILPHLDNYPLTEVIVHPRIAKQLYTGTADRGLFSQCTEKTNHNLCYNGDIGNVEELYDLQKRFPTTNRWMIARALIANPFLALEIKTGKKIDVKQKRETFKIFHQELVDNCLAVSHGQSQLLRKMLGYWEYFSQSFSNSHKSLKRVKKAKTIEKYWAAVHENLREDAFS